MTSPTLSQIEESINRLPIDDQLRLIERVAQRIRELIQEQTTLNQQLTAMAADPEVQRELRKIDEEFAVTESDGLEAS